jgi:hypothetical protein
MLQVINEQEQYDVMTASRRALEQIQSEREKKPLFDVLNESYQKASVGAQLFEPYDQLIWEGKVKVDMLYFDQFIQKLEETETLQKAFGAYFKNIREIYEFVNIRPEIYGNGLTYAIFEKSNEQIKQKVSGIIYEYFDKNFYKLDTTQRKNKYFDLSSEYCKTLISEGVNPDEAISFSVKTVIVEGLLTKIAFPFSAWSRVKYLTESPDYGLIFDQHELVSLVESFENKTKAFSKVIAATI